jgi:hypothetical protein
MSHYGGGGPPQRPPLHPLLAAQYPSFGRGKGGKGRRKGGFGGRGGGKGGSGGRGKGFGGRRKGGGKGGGGGRGGGRGRGRGGGARRDGGPPRFDYDAVVGDPWASLAPRSASPVATPDPAEIALDGDSSSGDDGGSAPKRARVDES